MIEQAVRYPAEQALTHPAIRVAAGHQQVGAMLVRGFNQFLADRAFCQAWFDIRGEPVAPQVATKPVAHVG